MTDFLTTEDGEVITTESGDPIVVQEQLQNGDIQLFDFSVNLLRALLWEYNDAAKLQALLEAKSQWYAENQTRFWRDWIQNIFDLRTANDFGLAVWSIILDQPTFINNGPDPITKPTWGFGAFRRNFNRGNFSSTTGSTYQFPTDIARILLQLRYFQLVSSGTVPETNRMLNYVFANMGKVYLQDKQDMTQRYVFTFRLPSNLQMMLNSFDILPRPASVESSYYQAAIEYFGFGGYHANFNRGNFAP